MMLIRIAERHGARLVLFIVVVAGGLLAGCAAAPLKELPRAQEAVALAKQAGADQYASDLLHEAEAGLNEAMALAPSRRRAAQELLERTRLQAEVAAELARERATAEQLQAAREQRERAQAAATAAQQEAQNAKADLGKPVTVPGTIRTIPGTIPGTIP
jgi:hypothetical protein